MTNNNTDPRKDTNVTEKKVKKSRKRSYYGDNENSGLVGRNMPAKVPFAVVEAYKNLRIHLISALGEKKGKIFAVSSPNASEGKSTTSVNIAITMSHLKKKILLIDADVRRSTVDKKLRLSNEVGCSDVLAGTAELSKAIKNYNPYLDVLTSGSVTNNPSELFSSTAFDRLLTDLAEKYEYIVIDTPPINLVSDTLAIAQKCDGLVLVVRPSVTTYAAYKESMKNIKQLNINLLGTVINGQGASKKKYGIYNKYKKYDYYNYSYNK